MDYPNERKHKVADYPISVLLHLARLTLETKTFEGKHNSDLSRGDDQKLLPFTQKFPFSSKFGAQELNSPDAWTFFTSKSSN